jgi:hypothetical protein
MRLWKDLYVPAQFGAPHIGEQVSRSCGNWQYDVWKVFFAVPAWPLLCVDDEVRILDALPLTAHSRALLSSLVETWHRERAKSLVHASECCKGVSSAAIAQYIEEEIEYLGGEYIHAQWPDERGFEADGKWLGPERLRFNPSAQLRLIPQQM